MARPRPPPPLAPLLLRLLLSFGGAPPALGLRVPAGRGVGAGAAAAAAATPVFEPESDAILIYSAPKTATTTLNTSLQELLTGPSGGGGAGGGGPRLTREHDTTLAHDFLLRRKEGSHTWVISVARDPFAQRISHFFQGIDRKHPVEGLPKVPMETLHREFHEEFVKAPGINWWAHLHFLGVNITSIPAEEFHVGFSKDGVLHLERSWRGRRLSFLILRVEDMKDWERTLRRFFPGFRLLEANVGADKNYADAYGRFLRSFRYSQAEVDCVLRSDVLPLYTEEEVEAFFAGKAYLREAKRVPAA